MFAVVLGSSYRVLKWWRRKSEISEIMGFVSIFWKNNFQEAYLSKMSISGQIVSEIVVQLCLENSIQTLVNFFFGRPKKYLPGFAWSFPSITGLRSQRQFAPKCSLWQVLTNLIISEISCLWRHHFSTLLTIEIVWVHDGIPATPFALCAFSDQK